MLDISKGHVGHKGVGRKISTGGRQWKNKDRDIALISFHYQWLVRERTGHTPSRDCHKGTVHQESRVKSETFF